MQFIKRRARNLLAYPSFQLRLVMINMFVMLSACGAVAFLMQRSDEAMAGGVILFAALLSVTANIALSHRVAGPIMRTRTYLEGVRRYFTVGSPKEDVPRLKFREGDFFADLPEKINGALTACIHRSGDQKKGTRDDTGPM